MTRNQICEDILKNYNKNKLKENAKHLKEDEDVEKDFTTEDAVQDAFPMISPHTVEIIAKWYENEYAIDDFDTLQEFSEHISSDFLDMFWAGDYDNEEFHEVAQDMVNVGYYDADRFPYDEDLEESVNKKLQESEKYSIEDIVMPYSSWSGTDMKYSVECCAEELKAAGYSPKQVTEYFDSDGYYTEDNPEGCWDPEFANRIVSCLQTLYTDEAVEKFCILMDWEIKPEDIKTVTEVDGKYIIHLNIGESFTYDPENDCIED